MKILVINTGSASTKLATYAVHGGRPERRRDARFRADEASPETLLRHYAAGDPPADAVCHRVVHGGPSLTSAVRLTPEVEREIETLAELAPLHNPVASRWIAAARHVLPGVPMAAVFDTAYYAELPPRAAAYALPRTLAGELHLRRYGFHGTAHRALWERWCALRPDLPGGGRLISLQLGGGCSVTASAGGRPVDTSMGFSPVEGLVMATRTGDIDPALITYLIRRRRLSADDIDQLLNEQSGLLGLAGSADMRELLAREDDAARLAVDLYCYRARKYVGAYLTVLGGADGIVFGGGVGEHAGAVRHRILADMQWCGIALAAGEPPGGEARISAPASAVDVWVIPVEEGAVLAREAYRVLS